MVRVATRNPPYPILQRITLPLMEKTSETPVEMIVIESLNEDEGLQLRVNIPSSLHYSYSR